MFNCTLYFRTEVAIASQATHPNQSDKYVHGNMQAGSY